MNKTVKILLFLLPGLLWVQYAAADLGVLTSSTDVSCYGGSDGTGQVIFVSGGTAPYTYQWFNNDFTPITDSTNSSISGLSKGTYFVRVWDSGMPVDSGTASVNIADGPNTLLWVVGTTDATCAGDSDGEIIINVIGGTPPFEYSLTGGAPYSPGTNPPPHTFSGLSAGSYNVAVIDSKGCENLYIGNPVVIGQPAPMTVSLEDIVHNACNGTLLGEIDITTNGGNGGNSWNWTGPGGPYSTEDLTLLAAGDYDLYVEDMLGCNTTSGTHTVNEGDEIIINEVTATDELCRDDGLGTITVDAEGGTGQLRYRLYIEPATYVDSNTNGLFSNLDSATYMVSVTDANNCGPVDQGGINVDNPMPISILSQDTTSITCYDADNGIIRVVGSGGTPPYRYLLYKEPASFIKEEPSGIFNLIAADPVNRYYVSVTDANTCTPAETDYWLFEEPDEVTLVDTSVTHVSCNNGSNGSITMDVAGGSGTYSFTLTPGGSQPSGTFSGLTGGTYDISAVDSKGCAGPAVNNILVRNPDPITIDSTRVIDIRCATETNGEVRVYAKGGTGALVYTLNPSAGVEGPPGIFTALPAAIYDISVTDANTCTPATAANLEVEEPTPLTVGTEDTTSIKCNNDGNGIITVSGSGGTAPYTYSLYNTIGGHVSTNPVGNGVFPGLGPSSPGRYYVEITDANGCGPVQTSDWEFTNPAPVTITGVDTSDVTCTGLGNGSLEVSAGGGTPPYSYTLNEIPLTQGSGVFSGLGGGTYSVTATDLRGCPGATAAGLEIIDPLPIQITFAGKDNITCSGAGDGQIVITAQDGTSPLKYILKNPVNPVDSNYTGTFTGLNGGNYSVDVTDTNRCGPVNSGVLNLVDPLPITIDPGNEDTTSITCFGRDDGTITITASGGTLPYTYSLTPGSEPDNDNGIFTGLPPANGYQVSVTDKNTCPPALSSTWDFEEPATLTLTGVDTSDVTCAGAADGFLEVNPGGGTPPYYFTLTPGSGTQTDSVFTGLSGATYSVSVTDTRDCPPATVNDLVVFEPAAITILDIDTNDVSCFGADDGSIIVNATGGTDTLYYTLTPGPYQNTDGDFSGVLPGTVTYSLSITDVNGCDPATAGGLLVTEPPELVLANEDTAGISCNGFDDAYIDITVTGGTDTITYILFESGAEVDTNYNNGRFENLAPGTYFVEVDDDNGCGPLTSNTYVFNEPGAVSASVDGSSSRSLTCYGDSTGSLNITVSGGYTPHTYEWTGPGGFTASTKNISGLKAGNYNLTVRDAKGCPVSYFPIDSIVGPPEFTMSLVKSDVSCWGQGDGAVTINVSGGTPGYEFSKNGLIWQTSNVFDPLNPGTYTFYVEDTNDCQITLVDTISQPIELEITMETVDKSAQLCNGDSNAIITITAKGGTGPLEYSIDSGYSYYPNNTFTGIGGGNYKIFVRDSNLCVVEGGDQLIPNPPLLYIFDYAQQDIASCFTSPEGRLVIEGGGGSPPLRYTLDVVDTNQTGLFENLSQGGHDLRIIDTKGCTKDTSIVINAPPPINVTTTITHISTCWFDSAGVIGIIASGGSGLNKGYVFGADTTFSADTVFYDSLPAGSYDFTVIDSLGCEVYPSAMINAPDSISTDSVLVFPVSCHGDTDGEIRVYGSGGTPPYNYILTPGDDTSTTGIYTGLAPGTYDIRVSDTNNCKAYMVSGLDILEPAELSFDSSSVTNISCGGFADGMISIHASGGRQPYLYSVNDGVDFDTVADVGGLGPGTYRIFVMDSAGCTVPGDTIALSDPPGLSLLPSVVDDVALCAGDSTGSITVSASGGTGSLEYSLDSTTWQSSGTFDSLPAGIYTAVVRDSKTCMAAFPADTVEEPPPITATITTTTAMIPDDGTLNISASGGTPDLEFSVDSGKTFTADTFYQLPSEIYYVVVRDANLCIYREDAYIPATPPLDVNTSSTNIACYADADGSIVLAPVNAIGQVDYSIDGGVSWQDTAEFINLVPGFYNIEVTDSHRVFRDTIEIISPPPFDVTASITPATCSRFSFDGEITHTVSGATPPYTYLWTNDSTTKDLGGLEEGTYGITITDQAGCEYSDSYDVSAQVVLRADAGSDTMVCYGATIQLDGSGGDEFIWSPEVGLNPIDIPNPTATITDTAIYVLFTRDSGSGCSDRDTVIIFVHPDRGLSAGQDTTVAPGQVIALTATGGPYSEYLWEPSEGLDNPALQTPTATVAGEITYVLTATTEFGCPETDSMSIFIATGLHIYSGFTPNDDGVNDHWDIDDILYYPNATVKVVDRWGKTVFSSVGYADNQRWDGKYKGKPLPIGTYYYIIDLKDGSEPYKGPVTIVR